MQVHGRLHLFRTSAGPGLSQHAHIQLRAASACRALEVIWVCAEWHKYAYLLCLGATFTPSIGELSSGAETDQDLGGLRLPYSFSAPRRGLRRLGKATAWQYCSQSCWEQQSKVKAAPPLSQQLQPGVRSGVGQCWEHKVF
jgi:hypothetical protein